MIHTNTSLPYQTNEILATRKYKGKTTITTRANQTNTMKKNKIWTNYIRQLISSKKNNDNGPKIQLEVIINIKKYQTRIQYNKQIKIDKYMHKKHH